MRAPQQRGTAINNARYEAWLALFSGYADQVTRRKIELWLDQFEPPEKDLAARILDAVQFFGHEHIRTTLRELLAALPGWHADEKQRVGRWFFVPFSGSVGESGDSMVHAFRMATGMTLKRFNSLFVHRSELVSKRPGPEDTVVLIDDFSGTGTQATRAWKELYAELLAEQPRVILMLVAATDEARSAISNETDMELFCGTLLAPQDNFFNAACSYFSAQEKSATEHYCKRADSKTARGSGSAGLLIVFAHRCPNNSLPILHANHQRWSGLFPRDLG
jgi:hypothetical protein